MLGFTYFREHPAEWRLVNSTGDGFRLRAEIVKYQCEIEPGRGGFKDRLGIMDQVCKPTLGVLPDALGPSPWTICEYGAQNWDYP